MFFRLSGWKLHTATICFVKTGILYISLNLFAVYCSGKGIKETSSQYDKALFEILNLNNVTARKILEDKSKNSSDSVNMFLEYLDNWNNSVETALYEDQVRYEQYLKSLDLLLERIDKKADKSSPSYHILLAEIYAQAGMVQIFYRDYISGFIKIMKAKNNARINLEKYPDYWMNNKLCGVLNVAFDQMSPFLKRIAGLFNISGNPKTGFRQLSEYLSYVEDYPGLKSDALLYYGFALRIAKDEERGYSLFKEEINTEKTPVLTLFIYSNLMCLTGRNEEARNMLSKFAGHNFEVPFPFMNYLYGKVTMNRLDQGADIYLKKFIMSSKSKNFKRETCCRLSDYYLVNSDTELFNYYRHQMSNYARATTDRDREADVELNRPYLPCRDLLKARYLIQGGYYSDADSILSSINPGELSIKAYWTEYYLLTAKVEFSTKRMKEALLNCNMAISQGKQCDEHYAAEAALLAGDILAKTGNREKATDYYKMALEIKGQNDVYIEIIEKMARNRLNNI
jgi:tetratricopeptide (TPR) repeat protein